MVCFALFFFFGPELAGLASVQPESVCFGSFARVSANQCDSGNEKKKNTGQGTDARVAVLLARRCVGRRCSAHFATFVHPRAQLVDTSERCQPI